MPGSGIRGPGSHPQDGNLLGGLATPSSGARPGGIGVMVQGVGTAGRRRVRVGSGRSVLVALAESVCKKWGDPATGVR